MWLLADLQLTHWVTVTSTHSLMDWLHECLSVWLTDSLIDRLTADWLTDWLTDSVTDWLTAWPTDWPTYGLTHRLIHWPTTCWVTDWPTYWLTDWLTDSLSYWLTISLTPCLTDSLSHCLTDRSEQVYYLSKLSKRLYIQTYLPLSFDGWICDLRRLLNQENLCLVSFSAGGLWSWDRTESDLGGGVSLCSSSALDVTMSETLASTCFRSATNGSWWSFSDVVMPSPVSSGSVASLVKKQKVYEPQIILIFLLFAYNKTNNLE